MPTNIEREKTFCTRHEQRRKREVSNNTSYNSKESSPSLPSSLSKNTSCSRDLNMFIRLGVLMYLWHKKKNDWNSNNGESVTITNKGCEQHKSHDDKQKTMLKDIQHRIQAAQKCYDEHSEHWNNIVFDIGNSISSLFLPQLIFSLLIILSVSLVFFPLCFFESILQTRARDIFMCFTVVTEHLGSDAVTIPSNEIYLSTNGW